MNLTFNDLMPGQPATTIRSVSFRLPLTPFFVDEATTGNMRTRSFRGNDFIPQYKNTRRFRENGTLEDEPICGFAAYRKSVSVDFDRNRTFPWNGTITRSYVFDRSTNQVRVATVEQGTHAIGLTHTRTANTAKQGDAFQNPPTHVEITLSEPVNKTWLLNEWQRWLGEPEHFRTATGSGLGTYSYIGHGATRSESDGWFGIVGGGDAAAHGPWFSGTPSGMTGDEGGKWNGRFSTWVKRVRRRNAPVVYRESSTSNGVVTIGGEIVAVGDSIYRQGYAEMELSEPVGDLWMDERGVFQQSKALEGFPMSATPSYDFHRLLSHTGDGEANELTLVSRTGKSYRVTLETGRDESGDGGYEWVTRQSHVLTTDTGTLQATLKLEKDEDAWSVRVARIEEGVFIDGHMQWRVVADVDAESPHPASLIGPDVVGPYLLLAAMKTRRGSRFGFPPLVYSEQTANDRYRMQTFRLHRNPGAVTAHGGGCGVGYVGGSADLEWREVYDMETGQLLPREVIQWQLVLNGLDWTQESYSEFDRVFFTGSTLAVQTATKLRYQGTQALAGRFVVAFDAPDPQGKVIATGWEKAAMIVDDNRNRTALMALYPPLSGESLFFEGHRLTYEA